MKLNRIEAFGLLESFGVRCARVRRVDSAEDAIAFSEHRLARDPRFIPITLYAEYEAGENLIEPTLQSEDAVRRAYDRLFARVGGEKIIAQSSESAGTDLAIVGDTSDELVKYVALNSATNSVARAVPIGAAGAAVLANHYEGHGHAGARLAQRRMLEHLLERISDFFEKTEVSNFVLTVRLHENRYTVIDAQMTAPHAIRVKKRLEHHARDRKGHGYHPAGRQ